MKQAVDKPAGQNLSWGEGVVFPLSFAVAGTQVQNNGLQTEMKEKSENKK
jgi:hypothetical protein